MIERVGGANARARMGMGLLDDDFLSDSTCLNALTMTELQARVPYVPSLEAVLNQARKFNQSEGPLSGLLIVELKAAAPLCDAQDTQERAIVSAVVRVVKRMRMTQQVMFTSLSPALLLLASEQAPEIVRILSVSGVQFLTAKEAGAYFDLPVAIIHKTPNLGLQWAEIGWLYRLPGYASVEQLLATALAVSARVVEADLALLHPHQPDAAKTVVAALHAFGLKVFGWTVTEPFEWFFLEGIGVDGIYVNDVPFGVAPRHRFPDRGLRGIVGGRNIRRSDPLTEE
jgi:glycerophosphoryl diester phosphodiesterase